MLANFTQSGLCNLVSLYKAIYGHTGLMSSILLPLLAAVLKTFHFFIFKVDPFSDLICCVTHSSAGRVERVPLCNARASYGWGKEGRF